MIPTTIRDVCREPSACRRFSVARVPAGRSYDTPAALILLLRSERLKSALLLIILPAMLGALALDSSHRLSR